MIKRIVNTFYIFIHSSKLYSWVVIFRRFFPAASLFVSVVNCSRHVIKFDFLVFQFTFLMDFVHNIWTNIASVRRDQSFVCATYICLGWITAIENVEQSNNREVHVEKVRVGRVCQVFMCKEKVVTREQNKYDTKIVIPERNEITYKYQCLFLCSDSLHSW